MARFIEAGELTEPFYRRLLDFLRWCLPNYRRENRAYLTVGIGCTGGRHRSVYIAERLGTGPVAASAIPCASTHRDEAPELNMTAPDAPATLPVGLLLLSHGPLAEALRETVRMLEPDEHDDVGALSLEWDEAPESGEPPPREGDRGARDRGTRRRPPDRPLRRHAVQPRARVSRARVASRSSPGSICRC